MSFPIPISPLAPQLQDRSGIEVGPTGIFFLKNLRNHLVAYKFATKWFHIRQTQNEKVKIAGTNVSRWFYFWTKRRNGLVGVQLV
jgi:hypothetical protein